MRILAFIISAAITITLVIMLNTRLLAPVPLGAVLSPQHGLWQNAEAINDNLSAEFAFPALKADVNVYLDDRLVPHVFAEKDEDLYFVQGFLHAKYRLWQMEFQTHAAAGRISELFGDTALNFDRQMRRLGMVYAAENSLRAMESDAETKLICDSYSAGVNTFINSLTESSLPVEYKLLGYKPEKWSNLKTALFLKYMALDLAGYETDFEMTNALSMFSISDLNKLYPLLNDSLDPMIPRGTAYGPPGLNVVPPDSADSLYFHATDSSYIRSKKPNPDNGSNNWAVAGSKTRSGYPILANDPHLGLNLPSLWYEMQLSTPSFNVYGVSFPGAPGVIIGYNDSCAFGFTNSERDVRDYYEIKFRDDSRKEYWFDNTWKPADFRVEKISVKGQPDFTDTIAYTIFGPVMYDTGFSGGFRKKKFQQRTDKKYYAVRWKAHDPSNELKMFTLLNRAKNYSDYYDAISFMQTPGQNCIFASKSNQIAIWQQGAFPAKWKYQGEFIMPGTDSSYMWQGVIPRNENPNSLNPPRGFVSSGNQYPVDETYPYYLGGHYPLYRGLRINRRLSEMTDITPQAMMNLQTDNYNVFAEMARPLLLKNIRVGELSAEEKKYYNVLASWDLRNNPGGEGTTVFVVTWDTLSNEICDDEFKRSSLPLPAPDNDAILENLLRDSAFSFIDNVNTEKQESLTDLVTIAFKNAVRRLRSESDKGNLKWEKFKNTKVNHLLSLDAFSHESVSIGGGANVINAATGTHGPSWRMIVHLSPETEAYGIYPGGQSGNPGSKFYDNFIDHWAAGKYYKLWMMKKGEEQNSKVIGKLTFKRV